MGRAWRRANQGTAQHLLPGRLSRWRWDWGQLQGKEATISPNLHTPTRCRQTVGWLVGTESVMWWAAGARTAKDALNDRCRQRQGETAVLPLSKDNPPTSSTIGDRGSCARLLHGQANSFPLFTVFVLSYANCCLALTYRQTIFSPEAKKCISQNDELFLQTGNVSPGFYCNCGHSDFVSC